MRILLALSCILALALIGPPSAVSQEEVIITVQVPKVLAGHEVGFYIDGEGLRLRIPAEGKFTLVRKRPRTGAMVLVITVRQRPSVAIASEWSARPELIGSGRLVWTLQPIGGERIVQWPLVQARNASTEPLEVLLGGKLMGRTPVGGAIEPNEERELLWRQLDGSTVCTTMILIPADSTRTYQCDPATGKVTEGNDPN